MSILVLRHEPFEHLGYFSQILAHKALAFSYRDLWDYPGDSPGGLRREGPFQALIVMGGPQSANDADAGIQGEIALVRGAIQQKLPVLGICLGAQMIAKALDAPVYRNPVPEIGWQEVLPTFEANEDPVFGRLRLPANFFHWHYETFDLPVGAVRLAYSEHCRNQAFRYGSNVYGMQFHPEITPEMIADWSREFGGPGLDPEAFPTRDLATTLFEGWLGTWFKQRID
jgi:GMP synthase-like glutamine amidotransferase